MRPPRKWSGCQRLGSIMTVPGSSNVSGGLTGAKPGGVGIPVDFVGAVGQAVIDHRCATRLPTAAGESPTVDVKSGS